MYCPRCGAQTTAGSAFCSACGGALGQVVTAGPLKRPGIVTLLAVLQFVGAAVGLLVAAVILVAGAAGSAPDESGLGILGVILGAVGFAQLMCGIGLWTLKPYGRFLQLAFAWIGLLGIPIGTIISILILVYMFKPGVRTLFSGRTAAELTPQELAEVAAASHGSGAATAVIVAVVALVSMVIVGIIAAIAIPGLLRARMSANETAAMASIRQLITAEASYSVANGGYPDVPRCLVDPAKCQPSYSGPPLLDESFTSALPRRGYVFQFHPGPSLDADTIRSRGLSPTSLSGFTFTAEPEKPGVTGRRGFCGDHTGALCYVPEGVPMTADGNCAPACRPLR